VLKEGVAHHDPVPSRTLGHEQRLIGRVDQRAHGHGIGPAFGHTDAGRDRDLVFLDGKAQRADLLPHALGP
jgi:hypothetical protein